MYRRKPSHATYRKPRPFFVGVGANLIPVWAAAAAQGDGPPADVRAASRFQMVFIGDAAGALDIARSMPRCKMPGEAEERSAYNATVGYAGYAPLQWGGCGTICVKILWCATAGYI